MKKLPLIFSAFFTASLLSAFLAIDLSTAASASPKAAQPTAAAQEGPKP